MRTLNRPFGFSKKFVALALAPVFSLANAADDAAMTQLTKPDISAVSVGGGFVNGDSNTRSLFGQYNGLRKDDAYLLLDLDFIRRDDTTGTWTISRAVTRPRHPRGALPAAAAGDWKYYGEYSGLIRYYPRTINTSLQGAGRRRLPSRYSRCPEPART
jgi:hypothetical protein